MSEAVMESGKPLSQVERVVDTFVAPTATFTDILRSTSWWLPFLLLVLVTTGVAENHLSLPSRGCMSR